MARGIPMLATGWVFNASMSLNSELEPCATHSFVRSSSASGLPLPACKIRVVGRSSGLSVASARTASAVTSRSAASADNGSSSRPCSACTVVSDTSALGAAAVRSSLVRPVRIRSSRVRGSLRATMWRIAALALSAACTSSTTSTSGPSSVAASTALRNESASRSGTTSADHSTGLGTPGKTLKISGETRDSSLSASGSAPPIPQQVRDPHELGARLRAQLRGEIGLEPRERLEGIGAVAYPSAGFDEAPHGVLGQRVQVVQYLRMPLDRGEIADAAPGVHLLHQTIADARRQLRPPLILPLLECRRRRHIEAVEECPPDL